MKEYEVLSGNAEDTQAFAKRLASFLKPGDCITLEGDLGAGKTTFTKGLAVGLGVTERSIAQLLQLLKNTMEICLSITWTYIVWRIPMKIWGLTNILPEAE